jgi:hypothetical protein
MDMKLRHVIPALLIAGYLADRNPTLKAVGQELWRRQFEWFATNNGQIAIGFIILFCGLGLYLLPTSIAVTRNARSRVQIFIVNIFFGWTFLGWAVALVWAFSPNTDTATTRS